MTIREAAERLARCTPPDAVHEGVYASIAAATATRLLTEGGGKYRRAERLALIFEGEKHPNPGWGDAGLQREITAAIHEAAASQVDWRIAMESMSTQSVCWENAVDWPDEPGLWCHLLGEVCEWIFTDNEFTVWNLTGEIRDEHRCGKFFGPMTPPLPAPPKPTKYVPKVGEWFWYTNDLRGGKWTGPFQCVAVHSDSINTSVGFSFGTDSQRFCKAEVSPAPPEE